LEYGFSIILELMGKGNWAEKARRAKFSSYAYPLLRFSRANRFQVSGKAVAGGKSVAAKERNRGVPQHERIFCS